MRAAKDGIHPQVFEEAKARPVLPAETTVFVYAHCVVPAPAA